MKQKCFSVDTLEHKLVFVTACFIIWSCRSFWFDLVLWKWCLRMHSHSTETSLLPLTIVALHKVFSYLYNGQMEKTIIKCALYLRTCTIISWLNFTWRGKKHLFWKVILKIKCKPSPDQKQLSFQTLKLSEHLQTQHPDLFYAQFMMLTRSFQVKNS